MRLAIALLLSTLLLGCSTTYYQVRDPGSGSTYYTTEIEEEKGGAVSLKDHRTNAQVTIQNSEVMEITGDQYDAAIRTVEVPAPQAPAAEPAEQSGQ